MTEGIPGWGGAPLRRRDGSVVRHGAARSRVGLVAALLVAVVTIGAAGWAYTSGALDRTPAAAPVASTEPTADPLSASSDPAPSPALPPAIPTEIRIPKIGITSSLVDLRLDGAGVMTTPVDFAVAGWYADGTVPGEMGPAIIAGHVDSKSGPAVFYRLTELAAGDVIEVGFGGRTVSFTVTGTGRYPKANFPTAGVYGPTPDAQLRLITCGGTFNQARNSYTDNIVVYAVAT